MEAAKQALTGFVKEKNNSSKWQQQAAASI